MVPLKHKKAVLFRCALPAVPRRREHKASHSPARLLTDSTPGPCPAGIPHVALPTLARHIQNRLVARPNRTCIPVKTTPGSPPSPGQGVFPNPCRREAGRWRRSRAQAPLSESG